jgi:hypothetical protein
MSLKDDFRIEQIDYRQAMDIVIANHYLHRKASCSVAFGLFHKDDWQPVGVIVYGINASSTLLKGICGPEEAGNVYELTRLWIDDSVPRNGESFLIGNTIRKLDKDIIVSFADASYGHRGIVYQATNFMYTGLSAKFKDPKVKGLEHQHHTTYANGMSNAEVIEKFGAENVSFVDRPRKHRYIFINATGRRRKELMEKLRYKPQPYPKEMA